MHLKVWITKALVKGNTKPIRTLSWTSSQYILKLVNIQRFQVPIVWKEKSQVPNGYKGSIRISEGRRTSVIQSNQLQSLLDDNLSLAVHQIWSKHIWCNWEIEQTSLSNANVFNIVYTCFFLNFFVPVGWWL